MTRATMLFGEKLKKGVSTGHARLSHTGPIQNCFYEFTSFQDIFVLVDVFMYTY